MAYNAMKWESHDAAYQHWAYQKHYWETEVQSIRAALVEKHGRSADTMRIIQNDFSYRAAISEETWARTQASYYAQLRTVDLLSRILFKLEKDE